MRTRLQFMTQLGVILLFVLAGGVACSTPVAPEKQQGDSGVNGGLDAGLLCEESIAEYCASDASLPCQLPADLTAFCPLRSSYGLPSLVGQDCTSFRYIHRATSLDMDFDAYYDLETDKLVAVVSHFYSAVQTARCNAGPPSFVVPRDPCKHAVELTCSDGGADARAGTPTDAARN